MCQKLEAALGIIKRKLGDEFPPSSLGSLPLKAFPHMRFLLYQEAGGNLPAHVDLTRTCPITKTVSTHTFIIYLTDCQQGGETVLLQSIRCGKQSDYNATLEAKKQQKLYIKQQAERRQRKEQQRQKYFGDHKLEMVLTQDTAQKQPKKNSRPKTEESTDSGILARIKPKRGRLLVFPHLCPHEGGTIESVPKILLRGEAF